MRQLRVGLATLSAASMLVACGGGGSGTTNAAGTGGHESSSSTSGNGGGHGGSAPMCTDGGAGGTGVAHVIIVIQENHTFDAYFGTYCTAAPGSSPTCTAGPSCCEAAPAKDPSGASPTALDDTENGVWDPNHQQVCELAEIDSGMMDRYVANNDPNAPAMCADPRNWAIATAAVVKPYHDLATSGAIADRYFQSIAGQSSSNDMYFAVAKEVFIDNAYKPNALGQNCDFNPQAMEFTGQTIADLLTSAGKKVTWYSEGYAKMVAAGSGNCPSTPADCMAHLPTYPCLYDPSDVPFLYYSQWASSTSFMQDYGQLAKDLAAGTLPEVSFVKALGYHTEHPGYGTTISDGATFVTGLVNDVAGSCYKDSTLILVTWDEGGGFFDHIAPPPMSTVDMQPYGTRVPLLALGAYAKTGTVSHTVMEHSSIVKFLEYNFLGQKTGQLSARDATVNNIGSLLDPAKVGETIPDQ